MDTKPKELTVGSLFSGIGGLDLGLERAGMRVVWQCEIDPYCRAVLAHHWPSVPVYEDIRDIDGTVEPVDLICGGFPCQPVSLAGKGLAQEDPRWLWPEFARVVGELRPRYVLVENVPGLVKRGLGDVITGLAEMGYDTEWEIVSAAACGAPHLRERLFIVATNAYDEGEHVQPVDAEVEGSSESVSDAHCVGRSEGREIRLWEPAPPRGSKELADPHNERCDGRPRYFTEENWRKESSYSSSGIGALSYADSGSLQPWGIGWRTAQASSRWWWAAEPPMGRVAHGVPNRLAQLRALGNAVVPQVAEAVGRMILEAQ